VAQIEKVRWQQVASLHEDPRQGLQQMSCDAAQQVSHQGGDLFQEHAKANQRSEAY